MRILYSFHEALVTFIVAIFLYIPPALSINYFENTPLPINSHQLFLSHGGTGSEIANEVIRGPYLQIGAANKMVIKWRTSESTDSKVWYGNSPNNLDQSSTNFGDRTDHKITLTGLAPNTVYYYAVGDSNGPMAGGENDYYFKTSPPTGSSPLIRAWVLGDSGTNNDDQEEVRDAYYDYIGNNHTDMILLLGDNAYSSGWDYEYQRAFFDVYPEKLINSVTWPAPGNHEYYGETGLNAPYYDIFSLPKNGEAGGLPSNTEKYYSFNYGNLHVISLDSYHEDRNPGSPMLTWLENDLAATTQDWIVVIFHHSPYSKGSHNTDSPSEDEMIEMRENVLPILESYGVDLVLTGHSHSYERSKLIHGHYGFSNTYDPNVHNVNGGDGQIDGNGPYQQNASEEGTVYIVSGTAGHKSAVGNHPVMFYSVSRLGSTLLEVNGDIMDIKFLNNNGDIEDYLTLTQTKSPTVTWTNPNDGEIFTGLSSISLNANAYSGYGPISHIEFFVDGISVGTDYSSPYSLNWTPSNAGNYTLKAVATDSEGQIGSAEITVSIQPGVVTDIAVRVSSDKDDAEERNGNGSINLYSTDLELIRDGPSLQTVGIRFRNVNVPAGANILDARIQFTVDETNSGDTYLTFKGQDHDDAPSFTDTQNDISNRNTTSASVGWDVEPWTAIGAAGSDQRTPNLSAVVQEIVNRSGWETNNSMAFVITGSARRIAVSHDGNPAKAPVLHVTYSYSNDPCAPYVDADNDGHCQNVDCDDTDDNIYIGAACDDGNPDTNNDVYNSDCECTGIAVMSLSVQVNSNEDDAEENISSSYVNISSSDLELVNDGSKAQTVGIRFKNINIPPSATVINAFIQFTVDETDSGNTNLTIRGEDHDDPPKFSSIKNNITDRKTTTASVNWNPTVWTNSGEAGADQRTPNISIIVNEIIGRPDWSANNSMVFIFQGSGERTAESYDGDAGSPPVLHIDYTLGTYSCDPFMDQDNDGYCSNIDCNDNNANIFPDAIEVCDGIDNDCDSQVDEGLTNTFYADNDGDGFGDSDNSIEACSPPSGYLTDNTDCDDEDESIFIGASCDDGDPDTGNDIYNDDCNCEGILATKISVQVDQSDDDAEERKSNGSIILSSSDLELIQDGFSYLTVGVRFDNLNIPPAAIVAEAYIQFTVDEADSGTTELTIKGHRTDDAPDFNQTTNNITSRPTTNAAVNWEPAPWSNTGEASFKQRTPDLSTIVQEIINRPGWTPNNAMAFVFTGSGERTADSYDGNPDGAPVLHVSFYDNGSNISDPIVNMPQGQQQLSFGDLNKVAPPVNSLIFQHDNGFSGNQANADGWTDQYQLLSGNNSEKKNSALHLYPNPATGQVNVLYKSAHGHIAHVELFDRFGKQVQFKTVQPIIGNNNFQMDVSQLPSGLYLFRIMESGEQLTEKVVVEN